MNLWIHQYWKTIVWSFVILFLSNMPGGSIHRVSFIEIPHLDKFVHFSMYFILTTLFYSDTFKKAKIENKKTIFYIIIVSIFYGVLMELFQKYFADHRSADIFDALANTIGVFSAILFLKIRLYKKWLMNILDFI